MYNYLVKKLFKKKRRMFEDLFLADLIGEVPAHVQEPASDFLNTAGAKWEKWLLWQSYLIQRKQIAEPQNSEILRGMLLEIKMLLMLAGRKKAPPMREVISEAVADPMEGVREFMKKAKEFSNGKN